MSSWPRASKTRPSTSCGKGVLRLERRGLIRGAHGLALLVLGILGEPGEGERRLRLGGCGSAGIAARAASRAGAAWPRAARAIARPRAGRGRARLELERAPIRGLGLLVQPGRSQRVAARRLDRGRVGSGAHRALGRLASRARRRAGPARARAPRGSPATTAPRRPGARTSSASPAVPARRAKPDWIARTRARTGAGAAPASSPAFASALPASSSLPSRRYIRARASGGSGSRGACDGRLLEDLDRLGFLALRELGLGLLDGVVEPLVGPRARGRAHGEGQQDRGEPHRAHHFRNFASRLHGPGPAAER